MFFFDAIFLKFIYRIRRVDLVRFQSVSANAKPPILVKTKFPSLFSAFLGEIRLFTRDPTGRYFKGAFYFPPILPHAKTVVSPSSEGIRGPYGTLVYHQSVILGTGTVFITVGVSPNNSERFLGLGLFFFL